MLINKILAFLPRIEIGLDDWHLHVSVGENHDYGITVGPHFFSLDKDNDIAHELLSPPIGYEAPLSDFTFSWNSRNGLTDLNIPHIRVGTYEPPTGWEDEPLPSDPSPFDGEEEVEEELPPTQRFPSSRPPRLETGVSAH